MIGRPRRFMGHSIAYDIFQIMSVFCGAKHGPILAFAYTSVWWLQRGEACPVLASSSMTRHRLPFRYPWSPERGPGEALRIKGEIQAHPEYRLQPMQRPAVALALP
jgi:hypothetical protein